MVGSYLIIRRLIYSICMDYNLFANIQYCRSYVDQFSGLLLYSHIPAAAIVILIGLYVFIKSGYSLLSRILLSISVVFAAWSVLDLLIWFGYARSGLLMSAWAPIEIFSVLLMILCFYFVYVFINKKNMPLWMQGLFSILLLSFILITPTTHNLIYYDLQECVAVENDLYVQYVFITRFAIAVLTLVYMVYGYIYSSSENKRQILILGVGIVAFLFAFFVSGYLADRTGNYQLEMYGLFAMVAFMATLAYLIVRFKTFDVKVVGAQALIVSLVVLIGSQFAFIQNNTNRLLTSITLLVTGIIGINLIRSVKKEIYLRQQLQVANEGQADMLHIINHQIKGYLTKARLIFDDLLEEKDYNLSEKAIPMVQQGFGAMTEGVDFVKDFLDASNIEKGTFQYDMQSVDFKHVVEKTVHKEESAIKDKGLIFEFKVGDGEYPVTGDESQLEQAVRNLVDNAVRYTPHGSMWASLEREGNKAIFKVKDTGVGLSDEVKPKLFTKGGRDKDSQKVNVNSTGFGLAFVKGVVEAHKGRVWAESEGPGKGSTFYMELPLNS